MKQSVGSDTGLKDDMSRFSLKIAFAGLVFALFTYITILYISQTRTGSEISLQIAIAVIFGGLFLYYIWVDNNHTATIRDMNKLVKSYKEKNLGMRLNAHRADELGDLNDSLSAMSLVMENTLAENKQKIDQMETILTSMVEGVMTFDVSGKLLLMNKTAEDMLGIDFINSRNRYYLEFMHHYQLTDLLKKALSDGLHQVVEFKLSVVDTEYYRIYVTPIKNIEEKLEGIVVVLRNITEVKILEQVRSDFVANVSHELRTPMTSIKGYVETLLDGAVKDKDTTVKFLEIIDKEADRLNRLIQDLLYLSEIETGKIELARKWINTKELIEQVVKIMAPLTGEKEIIIETMIQEGAESLFGNADMLEQVLINLLENAIKYSLDGATVTVLIRVCEQGRSIQVIDHGIGIPPESLSRIFERFYRVDKARSRKVGGTGLGLSIVKHVVDRHRGQISVESEEEKGTTFTVILPIK